MISNLSLENFKRVFMMELNDLGSNKQIVEYENPDFSKNLSRIITTKIPYINKYVWNKKS